MQNYIGYEHNKPSFLCAHNRRYPEAKTNPRPNAISPSAFQLYASIFIGGFTGLNVGAVLGTVYTLE